MVESVLVDASWTERYQALECYIACTPSIEIGAHRVTIPGEFREEFYSLFDKVRDSFIAAHIGKCGPGAEAISAACRSMKLSLTEKSNLETIKLANSLERFLISPSVGVASALYNPLMDLIRGNYTVDEFSISAERMVHERLAALTRGAYEVWLFLALLDRIEAREFSAVDFGPGLTPVAEPRDVLELGDQQALPQRRIPEMVVYCRDGSYVAFRYEFAPEVFSYNRPVLRRRDFTCAGDSTGIIGHRCLLAYRCASLNSIPTIADRQSEAVSSPDVMMEYLTFSEFETHHGRTGLAERASIMQPRNHTFVVLDAASDGVEFKDDEPEYATLVVGLDQAKLACIAERIIK